MSNPLETQLHDLITLMPDFQVDELLKYISELRATRDKQGPRKYEFEIKKVA